MHVISKQLHQISKKAQKKSYMNIRTQKKEKEQKGEKVIINIAHRLNGLTL